MKSLGSDKFFVDAMDKMFQTVGLESWDRELTRYPDWHQKHAWTRKQADGFKKWFIDTACRKLKWSKNEANEQFVNFYLVYGWSLK